MELDLDMNAGDFQRRRARCNLMANYVAAFVAYQYPAQRERAENLISTVVNELLETLSRLAPDQSRIHLKVSETAQGLAVAIDHVVVEAERGEFRRFIGELASVPSDAEYIGLLVQQDEQLFNHLGLAMLVHDFDSTIRLEAEGLDGVQHLRVGISTKGLAA